MSRSHGAVGVSLRIVLVAALIAPLPVLTGSETARAAGRLGYLEVLPDPLRERLDARLDLAATVRSEMDRPSYLSRMSAVIGLDRSDHAQVVPPAPPTAMDLRQVGTLPPSLQIPIAGLDSAVQQAEAIVGAPHLTRALALAAASPHKIPSWAERTAARSEEAALVIASALDTYLPILQATAGPASGAPAKSCDLLDQSPVLCVGSGANNTHTASSVLLIDLGGNDTYRNSAGGSFQQGGNAYPVSVNVDLAGDDTYIPGKDAVTQGGGAAIVQGAGLSGVGVAVDVAGDDDYRASLQVGPGEQTIIHAQGAGYIGTGALFDLGGDDTYESLAGSVPGTLGQVYGQAVSGLGGSGLLIDQGSGSDHYKLDGGVRTKRVPSEPVGAAVQGQAFADIGSSAVLSDDGGTDSFLATAVTGYESMEEVNGSLMSTISPTAIFNVQGTAFSAGATSLLLEGNGDTRYEVEAKALGAASNWIQAQGASTVQAVSALDDLAGNDLYRTHSLTQMDIERTVTSDCRCPAAEIAVQTHAAGLLGSHLVAQGSLFGSLHDATGDDRYIVDAEDLLDVTLRDRLKSPKQPPLLRAEALVRTGVVAQGGTTGFLYDETGRDDYLVRSWNEAHGKIIAPSSHGKPDMRVVDPSRSTVEAQGKSLLRTITGALVDGGGKGDHFSTIEGGEVTSEPQTDAAVQWGNYPSAAFIVAAGGQPVVLRSPSPPVYAESPSVFGFGTWLGCCAAGADADHAPTGEGSGYGFAPNAEGAAPTLTILPGMPKSAVADTAGTRRIQVQAELRNPSGDPMPGVALHFALEIIQLDADEGALAGARYWSPAWIVTAKTDRDGIATASVPVWYLPGAGDDLIPDPQKKFRVHTIYDGDEGIYPAHAAQSIVLKPPGKGG